MFKRDRIARLIEIVFVEEEKPVEIEVKKPGLLEVPDGKDITDLPIEHFKKLVKKKGYQKIARGLTNLIVWNKKKKPSLSKWADTMQNKLKDWVDSQRESGKDL